MTSSVIAIDDYVRGSLSESDGREVMGRLFNSNQLMHIVAYDCGSENRLTAFTVELLHSPREAANQMRLRRGDQDSG
jgi:hypothetical protein